MLTFMLNFSKKIYVKKWIFRLKSDLMWPSITSEVILHINTNLLLCNVSIYQKFYQNQLIDECAEKKKKLKSCNFVKTVSKMQFFCDMYKILCF